MCDMTAVAIGAEAAGTITSAMAAKQRGDAAKAEDYRSADAAERAAADATERGKLKESQVAAKGSEIVAEQRRIFSGSGADVNIGSPKAVQEATEGATDADRAVVRHNAEMEGYGLKLRARSLRQKGVNAQAEGEAAMVGTFLSGIAKIGGKVAGRLADVEPSSGPYGTDSVAEDVPGMLGET